MSSTIQKCGVKPVRYATVIFLVATFTKLKEIGENNFNDVFYFNISEISSLEYVINMQIY